MQVTKYISFIKKLRNFFLRRLFIFIYKSFARRQLHYGDIVGNKTKGRISKRVFQENKVRQIFRKMNISYPLIRTRAFTK